MKKPRMLVVLTSLAAVLMLPEVAAAQMYQYVTREGELETIEAPDASTAILVAPLRAPTSGVLLVDEAGDALPTNMEVPIDPTPPATTSSVPSNDAAPSNIPVSPAPSY
jgi:hypothetical protein